MEPGRSEFVWHTVMTVLALAENHAYTQRKISLVNAVGLLSLFLNECFLENNDRSLQIVAVLQIQCFK